MNSKLKDTEIKTKALPSRRAPVGDLSNLKWNSVEELVKDFAQFMDVPVDNEINIFPTGQWSSWEQIWGKTPNFKLTYDELSLEINYGAITSLNLSGKNITEIEIKLPIDLKNLLQQIDLNEKYQRWLLQMGLVF